ncbi:ribonuclease H-like [Alligator mississippiensis]|uniref:Ribonuclease H-like n=1 Tax=Alligator mississippiensis TaxID=8496 RepID=A0A151M1L3_ALLMI|nr:ribonuclease H-like [Alligator mississippiensis]
MWTVATIYPVTSHQLKDSRTGASSQWVELRALMLVVDYETKWQSLAVWIYTDSWAVANGLAVWSGTWKALNWKITGKDLWGQDLWKQLAVKYEAIEIHVGQVDAYQPINTGNPEHEWNNHVDALTQPVLECRTDALAD